MVEKMVHVLILFYIFFSMTNLLKLKAKQFFASVRFLVLILLLYHNKNITKILLN